MKQIFIVCGMILWVTFFSFAGDIKEGKIEVLETDNNTGNKLIVELKDDLISADINNVPLGDVLKEIEKKADIKMNIFDKPQ